MLPKHTYTVFILLFLMNECVIGQSDNYKSSLTFVIDKSFLKYDNIDQVKLGLNNFYAILTNTSHIKNFVLVTDDDTEKILKTVTEDRDEWKKSVNLIHKPNKDIVYSPENLLLKIKLALEASHPGSYVFVLTDSSTKQYSLYKFVKHLTLEKQCQVTFILPGEKEGDNKSLQLFSDLAVATSGEVYHVDNPKQIDKILHNLAYIKREIKRPMILTSKSLPAGIQNFTFKVKKVDFVTISLSSSCEVLSHNMTAPDGSKRNYKSLISLKYNNYLMVNTYHFGNYTLNFESKCNTTVVVRTEANFLFQHGFSAMMPTSIHETTMQPTPGVMSYASIELGDSNVLPFTIEIVNMWGNVTTFTMLDVEMARHEEMQVTTAPIILKNGQFYVTQPILIPNFTFRLKIRGYDLNREEYVTGFSFPIVPQKNFTDDIPTIYLEVGMPGGIPCMLDFTDLHDLIWYKEGIPTNNIGEYLIPHVTDSDAGIYTCKLYMHGSSSDINLVVVHRPKFSKMENLTVILKEEPSYLLCEANGFPEPTVTWYHYNVKLNSSEQYYRLEANDTNYGNYTCVVGNELDNIISRTFNVLPKDCPINVEQSKLPLIVPSLENIKWPYFEIVKNASIQRGKFLTLFCPSHFIYFPGYQYMDAFCDEETNHILVDGVKHDYSAFGCNDNISAKRN